jgi:[protein-PII] uridylyltransferase
MTQNTEAHNYQKLYETLSATQLTGQQISVATCKNILKSACKEFLGWFNDGASIENLVHGRAYVVDQVMNLLWSKFSLSPKLSLIAVGGYGRGELHPASDIDLLVLAPDNPDEFKDNLEQFIMFLWDIGLDIGHSVRTLNDCLKQASQDVTIATNLIEARLLCGNKALFQQLESQAKSTWNDLEFFNAKKNEQQERHTKYHDTSYNLEPNIKESPGGLRDIQTVDWIAKRQLGASRMRELVKKGFFTEEERSLLKKSQYFLWRIRFALHTITHRHEDRLLFDHQRLVATQLGFITSEGEPDVEPLMKKYFCAVLEISRLNEMLLQDFEKEIITEDNCEVIHPIDENFQINDQYIEVISDTTFEKNPGTLLEIFLVLQQHPKIKGVKATTIRLIREYKHLIDQNFRDDPKNRSTFISIFRQPRGLTHALRHMGRYGVLAAYLPAFEKITGQMQYDLFHHYTVDEHTLFVIRNMRRSATPEHEHELPYISKVMKRVAKPELLYLAGLFHDIGKGRGGNHSTLGASDAELFCQQHGLTPEETHLIVWLVNNHLIMSTTAQKKDISDPNVIFEFAQTVGSIEQLRYLYLLTVADIRATNSTLWNNWKDTLLKSLYQSTRNYINSNIELPPDQSKSIEKTKSLAYNTLTLLEMPDTLINNIWSNFNDDYFLCRKVKEVELHTRLIANLTNQDLPFVDIAYSEETKGLEVFIYTNDNRCLFAVATTVFAKMAYNVVEARIDTTANGYTLDTFLLLMEDTAVPADNEDNISTLKSNLESALSNIEGYSLDVSRILSSQVKHFSQKTEIKFFQNQKRQQTVIEVIATDKPGLLSQIGLAFSELGIQLHKAKIATLGASADDLFYCTNEHGQLLDNELQEKLKTRLMHLIE